MNQEPKVYFVFNRYRYLARYIGGKWIIETEESTVCQANSPAVEYFNRIIKPRAERDFGIEVQKKKLPKLPKQPSSSRETYFD